MAVLTLDFEYDYEFQLIGLISDVKEYKLAWLVNRLMGINLKKAKDLEFLFTGNKVLLISNFVVEEEHYTIRLLKNKAYNSSGIAKPYLLPEVKNYDYIIQIDGEYSKITLEDLKKAFKNYAIVQYSEIIDINTLKSKENLVY